MSWFSFSLMNFRVFLSSIIPWTERELYHPLKGTVGALDRVACSGRHGAGLPAARRAAAWGLPTIMTTMNIFSPPPRSETLDFLNLPCACSRMSKRRSTNITYCRKKSTNNLISHSPKTFSTNSWKSEISTSEDTHFVESFEIARRARQGEEMEESASHHL